MARGKDNGAVREWKEQEKVGRHRRLWDQSDKFA